MYERRISKFSSEVISPDPRSKGRGKREGMTGEGVGEQAEGEEVFRQAKFH